MFLAVIRFGIVATNGYGSAVAVADRLKLYQINSTLVGGLALYLRQHGFVSSLYGSQLILGSLPEAVEVALFVRSRDNLRRVNAKEEGTRQVIIDSAGRFEEAGSRSRFRPRQLNILCSTSSNLHLFGECCDW